MRLQIHVNCKLPVDHRDWDIKKGTRGREEGGAVCKRQSVCKGKEGVQGRIVQGREYVQERG